VVWLPLSYHTRNKGWLRPFLGNVQGGGSARNQGRRSSQVEALLSRQKKVKLYRLVGIVEVMGHCRNFPQNLRASSYSRAVGKSTAVCRRDVGQFLVQMSLGKDQTTQR
jgi:hypothetical protein